MKRGVVSRNRHVLSPGIPGLVGQGATKEQSRRDNNSWKEKAKAKEKGTEVFNMDFLKESKRTQLTHHPFLSFDVGIDLCLKNRSILGEVKRVSPERLETSQRSLRRQTPSRPPSLTFSPSYSLSPSHPTISPATILLFSHDLFFFDGQFLSFSVIGLVNSISLLLDPGWRPFTRLHRLL